MKIPTPFWFYFLPMAASSLGWIPRAHPFYTFLSQQLLPVCLVLLLIGTDLRSLRQLGAQAILLMLAGAAGTVIGGVAGFFLYKPWLPAGSWGAVGALTGSWIGGSANLLAVKEALAVSDSLIGPIILIDAAIAYSWMALLIASAAWQSQWNRLCRIPASGWPASEHSQTPAWFARSRSSSLVPRVARDTLPARRREVLSRPSPRRDSGLTEWLNPLMAAVLAVGLSLAAQWVGSHLPALGPAFTATTWTILLVTTAALALSLTPLSRLGSAETPRLGTWALYALLASIGARAHWAAVWETPVFFALGFTWILVHGFCLVLAGFLLKAPLGLIATASQANIGGPISAPMVGATFSPALAGVGLLLAILGNLLGTYAGLATGFLLRHA